MCSTTSLFINVTQFVSFSNGLFHHWNILHRIASAKKDWTSTVIILWTNTNSPKCQIPTIIWTNTNSPRLPLNQKMLLNCIRSIKQLSVEARYAILNILSSILNTSAHTMTWMRMLCIRFTACYDFTWKLCGDNSTKHQHHSTHLHCWPWRVHCARKKCWVINELA